jgi:chromate transporter
MVAYIRRVVVTKKRWLDGAAFEDGVALVQALPGATAMQCAAYVGLRVRGPLGAAAAFIGFGLPSFAIMFALSALYARGADLPPVLAAFAGLRVIIVALVAYAAFAFARTTLRGPLDAALALAAAAAFFLGVHPALVIFPAAALAAVVMRGGGAASKAPSKPGRPYWRAITWTAAVALTGAAALFIFRRPLFDLTLLMWRVDVLAFGGGYGALPLLFHEVVRVRGWLNAATFMDGVALGQVTPGPIYITAAFVGYMAQGPAGAAAAAVAVFLISFLLVLAAAPYFDRLRTKPWFERALRGIVCSFVGLLASTAIRFGMEVPWDLPRVLLAVGAAVALLYRVDIVWVVLVGAALSAFAFGRG